MRPPLNRRQAADQPAHRDRSGPASAPEPPARWPPVVFAVWMLVALAFSARLVLGFRLLRRLKRSAEPLPARYQDRLRPPDPLLRDPAMGAPVQFETRGVSRGDGSLSDP